MTVSNISPADGYLIEHGDSISFDLDDGGTVPTSIVLTVEGVVVYTLATGFATGYTGTTTKVSNVYTITVNKTGGWDSSPIEVEAAWTISGTPSTETWSYQLRTEAVYNNLMQPRNPVSVGRLIITEAAVAELQTLVGLTSWASPSLPSETGKCASPEALPPCKRRGLSAMRSLVQPRRWRIEVQQRNLRLHLVHLH